MLTPKFDVLVKQLQILPSVGQKSAQRMALQLLTSKRSQGINLAAALDEAMRNIIECSRCHSFSDDEICPICQDPRRNDSVLCVVETAADVMAIEQSGGYRGRYFVLGGHLSPLDGIGVDELNIDALIYHVKHSNVEELILATGTTVEGQTTAQFISQALASHVNAAQLAEASATAVSTQKIKITRLAQGIPVGGELGYLDSMTLNQAMENRGAL